MKHLRKLTVLTVALFTAASMMLFGFVWLDTPTVRAGDFECRETLGADTIVGNLIVPDDATCTLNGTQVQGSIVVKSRATLMASQITVSGGIQA
jgi:hypothetical protein